ncbi:hypothetical protein [Ramlibacter sp. WS9]|uniref:hypothetical protein n=1 Tax=Ramlibacter sp. WS9 TaxID=1882741 RepID=UPI0011438B32|nr:hypothetical protein [Ramlibacter sp. WS9]ROZ78252.1 hypothetical protein EEB15_07380 [Ramlibacter sp. WS9]
MRRFWLLLLALVMPLQMSWAAVHFCDDQVPTISADAAAKGAERILHVHDEQAKQGLGSDAAAEPCCGAAHGCHGLHNLIAQAAPGDSTAPSRCPLVASDDRMARRQFSDRHERPQWLPA